MIREFLVRVGTFFILIGIGILVLFIASDSAGGANFDYLFWAVLSIIVGFFLRRRREPAAPAERFGLLRGIRRRGREPKERR